MARLAPAPAPCRGLTVNALARVFLSRVSMPLSGRGRALEQMGRCRTEALGGRIQGCGACGYEQFTWNGCLHRNCPSCMGVTSAKWVSEQLAHLLPVPYFHVVFTLPHQLRVLALHNKRLMYGALMRISAQTVQSVAREPAHLGAEVGIQSVLHTWSQRLEHHPHVHLVIPAGGIASDGRWRACRPRFFLPTKLLAARFRARFLEALSAYRDEGRLRLSGGLGYLRDDGAWLDLLAEVRAHRWVVYAKRPFAGPAAVLKYLAGYTHRGPISNGRLLGFDGETVTFKARGRAGGLDESVRLPLREFIRRFLFHIPPKGFIRLRAYGFLSHRVRKERLTQLRAELGEATPPPVPARTDDVCPRCCQGRLEAVADVTSVSWGQVTIYESANAINGPPQLHSGPWRAA